MSSISSIGSDSTMQQLMAQMYTSMSKADTDGTAGLSKTELSSIDTSGDAGGGAFLQSLSNQFSTLDANQDGQLSSDEISQAKPVQPQDAPLGPPPGMFIQSDEDSSTTSTVDSSSSDSSNTSDKATSTTSAESFLKDFINHFDTNGDGKVTMDEFKQVFDSGQKTASSDATSADATSTATTATDKIASSDSASASSDSSKSDFGEELKNLSSKFLQKLIDSYNNSGSSGLSSALSSVL